jgi:hypothetical protein
MRILLLLPSVLLFSTGCATITRGDKQLVHLVTDPPAAEAIVDGAAYVTPADVVLKRKQGHEVTVRKPGYQSITFKLSSHWDAGGIGAVAMDAAVPGGSALFVIDWLSGSDRHFDNLATIKLPPNRGPEASQPVMLYEYKGKLMSKGDFDDAVEHDKLFKSKTKQPATQPAPQKNNGG